MRIFIYEDLPVVSPNWHSDGGLVVVAAEQPRTIWVEAAYGEPGYGEGGGMDHALPEPTAVYPIAGDAEPRTFVFPDAGCC
jgi:hypothetical protein